ncbi:hypothetical protein PPYR_00411, partial [Photinus pyralis]
RPQGIESSHSRPLNVATSRPSLHLNFHSNSEDANTFKRPTQPPRHSILPVGLDTFSPVNLSMAFSTHVGWQITTEPNFITGHKNSSYQAYKPNSLSWHVTTEPGFVTKNKNKASYKPKPKPSKKPVQFTTSKNPVKFSSKPTRTTTLR